MNSFKEKFKIAKIVNKVYNMLMMIIKKGNVGE